MVSGSKSLMQSEPKVHTRWVAERVMELEIRKRFGLVSSRGTDVESQGGDSGGLRH